MNTITAQQIYDILFMLRGKDRAKHGGMEGKGVTEGRVENVRVSVSVPRCPLECSR